MMEHVLEDYIVEPIGHGPRGSYHTRCQILGFVARIRNNEVHNDNEAQKMTMELMIDCLATLRDVWCRCSGGVFPELLMRRYNLGYLVSSLSPQDDCARFRIDPSI